MNDITKLPPQNIEAEQNVLGGLISREELLDKIAFLTPDDFYKENHKLIFTAIQELKAKNDPINLLTITNHFDEKQLQTIGGRSYVVSLMNMEATYSEKAFKSASKIVKEKSVLREIQKIGHETVQSAFNEENSLSDIISTGLKKFENVSKLSNLTGNFNPEKISSILAQDFGDYNFIVDKMIPRSGITILSGRPKSGKSWFVLYLLAQIQGGNKAFDQIDTKKCKVLLIDEENSKRGIQRRIKKINIGTVDFPILSLQGFKVDKPEHRDWLKTYIRENNIELVVFDSFRRIHNKDENKSEDIADIYDSFKDIMTADVGILVIHHNRKIGKFEKVDMESLRGSGDIGAMVDAFILIESNPLKDNAGNSSVITTVLREDVASNPFRVDWYDTFDENNQPLGIVFEHKGEVLDEEKQLDKIKDELKEIIKENYDIKFREITDIIKETGIEASDKTVRRAIKVLEGKGLIDSRAGARNAKHYFWVGEQFLNEEKSPDPLG